MSADLRLTPVSPRSPLRLGDADARVSRFGMSKDDVRDALEHEQERVGKLQQVFHADGRFALLIVLQGRDAAGKDGAIRNVFASVDPQGCEVTSFKAPTALELEHDYLWRVHHRVPARGMFGIFNRSHYEDVLVVRVRKLVERRVWAARYDQINAFERMLAENRVVILKFFLHVSRAEQKERLSERLRDPTKNWKFRAGDLDDRARWPAYTAAYREALRRCSTPHAPWYVVPADDKQMRNLLMARTIADRLEALRLRYPRADGSVLKLRIT